MTLRAVHGNRTEALLGALIAALPPADPFVPVTIIVGSHLIARWLSREIALARGISAGLDLVTIDRFIERTWAGDDAAREAGLVALDRAQLAAAIASVLADDGLVRTLPQVAAYLAAAPAPGDRAGPRRVQLAEHLARLAWQYAVTRPDWMPALIVGRPPPDLKDDVTARWQATLIGAALHRLGDGRHAPIPMLPWARRRAGVAPPRLAAPVAVFGASFLQRAQLEALTDLAATTPVTVYLLDPCEELWDDVSGRKRATAVVPGGGVNPSPSISGDPLLLSLWGRAVRDTLGALVERTGGDVEGAFVRPPPITARDHMLADVLDRRVPVNPPTSAARGVAVLACPSPRREVEIVAAQLRAHLDADPSLRAHELAVWIAGDPETYLAQAPSAFEAVGVPCHLIDAPIDDRGRIGEAVLALLDLPTGSMTRRELLRVMTHPAVLAGHPHVHVDDWVRWTERLGIVHGADARAHAGTYLVGHHNKFHWDQGVRRLARGADMVGADRGAVTIDGLEVAPEEVRPEQQASAATYALLVRSLSADAAWLAQHEATLTEWANIFVTLVDAYLDRGGTPRSSFYDTGARRTGEPARDIERVRSMLAGIARVDLDGRRVGFREAREHASKRLVGARANRGEPLAAGVMIAPLDAMRAVPFRIACVVGLDEGTFPARDQVSPLDLRTESRPGDVSPRDRDRQAFFEVVLGAREALYLSYVAVEPKSGQPLGPSSVVLELADALAPYTGADASRTALEAMTTRHPLHRFGEGGGHVPPAVVRERWAIRVRDALRAELRAQGHPVPEEDGMLALLGNPHLGDLRAALGIIDGIPAPPATASRTLSISNLRSFLESPIQAWAQAVLGLDELPDDAVIDHSDEPFHVDRPARAVLLREVLAAQLQNPAPQLGLRLVRANDPQIDPDAHYDAIVKDLELRGQFPVGVFGEAARAGDLRALARWREELGPIALGAATRIGFGRSQSPTAELLPALELELSPGRTIRIVGQTELLIRGQAKATSVIPILGEVEKKSRYHLRGALDHLVLAAAGLADKGHSHVLLDPKGNALRVDHEPWTRDEAQQFLRMLVTELLDQPHGYLLPFDLLARALTNSKPSRFGDPTGGLGYGPIERRDGLDAPPNIAAIAQRRLGPLVSRMRGDHSFGVARD